MPGKMHSTQAGFTQMYEGNPPWDIGKPQAAFVEVADQIVGPLLDAGCGTGNGSVYFAARGLEVTGIDFVEEAIRRGEAKAAERGLSVRFLVKDAMTLDAWDETFASVIDSGLLHIYSGEERRQYVRGLAHVLREGGRLFLLGFSDEEPSAEGGVSMQELEQEFAEGWEIESVRTVRGEVAPGFVEDFPKEGPKMRFAVIRRTA
jgi:cyclopropane fatty-acyl-phospholipid synthase-like methyltransferase